MDKRYAVYETDIGNILIAEEHGAVTDVLSAKDTTSFCRNPVEESSLTREAARQLRAYLAGKLLVFDLPLAPAGTSFQLSVWRALLDIPYGQTRSYLDIATAVGNPKASRAVGMANHRNPISFIIPCHRVIGSDGSLVGYGGGLELKKLLLDLERRVLSSIR